MLKYLNRKFTAGEQNNYLFTYAFIGTPIGYLFVQIVLMSLDWEKYDFKFSNLIFTYFFDLLFALPLIINYFKNNRKYNLILNKIKNNWQGNAITGEVKQTKKFKVKAIYDYKNFKKGESYEIQKDFYFISFQDKKSFLTVDNYNLKDIINKFELDDLKEERLRKLKKLKKIW